MAETEVGDVGLSPCMPEQQLEETERTLSWSLEKEG